MDVFVDPTDRRGLSAQLYAQLRDAIVGGRLVAGDQLTPTRSSRRAADRTWPS